MITVDQGEGRSNRCDQHLRDPAPPPAHDPLTTVQGVATLYACPTLASVDAHLAGLTVRIAQAHALPKLVAAYRVDVDKLLERRAWLMAAAD